VFVPKLSVNHYSTKKYLSAKLFHFLAKMTPILLVNREQNSFGGFVDYEFGLDNFGRMNNCKL